MICSLTAISILHFIRLILRIFITDLGLHVKYTFLEREFSRNTLGSVIF